MYIEIANNIEGNKENLPFPMTSTRKQKKNKNTHNLPTNVNSRPRLRRSLPASSRKRNIHLYNSGACGALSRFALPTVRNPRSSFPWVAPWLARGPTDTTPDYVPWAHQHGCSNRRGTRCNRFLRRSVIPQGDDRGWEQCWCRYRGNVWRQALLYIYMGVNVILLIYK